MSIIFKLIHLHVGQSNLIKAIIVTFFMRNLKFAVETVHTRSMEARKTQAKLQKYYCSLDLTESTEVLNKPEILINLMCSFILAISVCKTLCRGQISADIPRVV